MLRSFNQNGGCHDPQLGPHECRAAHRQGTSQGQTHCGQQDLRANVQGSQVSISLVMLGSRLSAALMRSSSLSALGGPGSLSLSLGVHGVALVSGSRGACMALERLLGIVRGALLTIRPAQGVQQQVVLLYHTFGDGDVNGQLLIRRNALEGAGGGDGDRHQPDPQEDVVGGLQGEVKKRG